MVSSVFSTVKKYGDYGANFLLGTGADQLGKKIGQAVKVRQRAHMSLPKAVVTGFKKGMVKNQAQVAKSGGFVKNLLKTFKETPGEMAKGWSSGSGFLSKLGKSIKPLGKLMPFAMNALWFAQSVPDIVARTKDQGLWGGIKETGKALAKMAVFSVSAAVGGTFGFLGMMGLSTVCGMLADKVLGDPYKVKKEKEAEALAQQQAGGASQQTTQGGGLNHTNNPFMNLDPGKRLNRTA